MLMAAILCSNSAAIDLETLWEVQYKCCKTHAHLHDAIGGWLFIDNPQKESSWYINVYLFANTATVKPLKGTRDHQHLLQHKYISEGL